MRVLLTRPQDNAEKTARALEDQGIEVLIHPMLEIAPLPYSLPDKRFDALIFTSAHGAEHFKHAELYKDIPVFTVGQNTKHYAEAAGFVNVTSADGSAQDLLRVLQKTPHNTMLYIRGQDVCFPLEESLKKCGRDCTPLHVYKAHTATALREDIAEHLREGRIDCVMFYSRRSAEAFCTLMQQHGFEPYLARIKSLCISNNVLEYVRNFIWLETYSADEPNGQSMIEKLCTIL